MHLHWDWRADLYAEEDIAFVVGDALYLNAIHGGKAKTDRLDAHKIATLLRGGPFPGVRLFSLPPDNRRPYGC